MLPLSVCPPSPTYAADTDTATLDEAQHKVMPLLVCPPLPTCVADTDVDVRRIKVHDAVLTQSVFVLHVVANASRCSR